MPRSSQTMMVWSPSATSVASMTSSSGWSRAMVTSSRRGGSHASTCPKLPIRWQEAEAVLTAEAKVAFYLTDPAGETAGIGERQPEVIETQS